MVVWLIIMHQNDHFWQLCVGMMKVWTNFFDHFLAMAMAIVVARTMMMFDASPFLL